MREAQDLRRRRNRLRLALPHSFAAQAHATPRVTVSTGNLNWKYCACPLLPTRASRPQRHPRKRESGAPLAGSAQTGTNAAHLPQMLENRFVPSLQIAIQVLPGFPARIKHGFHGLRSVPVRVQLLYFLSSTSTYSASMTLSSFLPLSSPPGAGPVPGVGPAPGAACDWAALYICSASLCEAWVRRSCA